MIGSFVGYSLTQIACYRVGMIALVGVARGRREQDLRLVHRRSRSASLAFAVLAVRELDQSFVDTYSTAVSVQNLRPRWDRRVLAVVIGTIATVLTLALNIDDYYNFLVLLGSVFVPLLGVLAVDWFVVSRRQWDLDRPRPRPVADAGAVGRGLRRLPADQPRLGSAGGRASGPTCGGPQPATWMSASLLSFAVAALVTLPVGLLERRWARPSAPSPDAPAASPRAAAPQGR